MPKKVFKKEKLTKEQRRTKYTQIARDRSTKKRMQAAAQNLTCFQCRQRGHSLETCPLSLKAKTCCYKCGSTDHSLQTCLEKELNVPVSKMTLPFAACFVCNETGHLSSQCKQNKKGVYPDGGSCKHCGSSLHLAKDCADKKIKKQMDESDDATEILYDELVEQPRKHEEKMIQDKKDLTKKRVVTF